MDVAAVARTLLRPQGRVAGVSFAPWLHRSGVTVSCHDTGTHGEGNDRHPRATRRVTPPATTSVVGDQTAPRHHAQQSGMSALRVATLRRTGTAAAAARSGSARALTPALDVFAITFVDRMPAAESLPIVDTARRRGTSTTQDPARPADDLTPTHQPQRAAGACTQQPATGATAGAGQATPSQANASKATASQATGARRTAPASTWRTRGLAFVELLEQLTTDHLSGKVAATLDLDLLRAGLGAADIDTGGEITAGEVSCLACQAGIVPAVLGTRPVPLDLGRPTRLFTEPQRVALATIYDTCAAQNCDHPYAWTELHHQHPWAFGERTDLADAVPACRFHH